MNTDNNEPIPDHDPYRILFDKGPLPMWVCDQATLRLMDVNDAALRAYGYSREEFLKMTLLDLQLAHDFQQLLGEVHAAAGTKTVSIHRKKGSVVCTVETTTSAIRFNGAPAFLFAVNDISQRVQTQRSLVVSNELLNTFAAFVLVADTNGRITYAAPSVAALGYQPGELLGEGWWNVTRLDVEEAERARRHIIRLARGEERPSRIPYETTVRCKDGSTRWVLWQDSADIPGSVIGVGQDITARKATEDALARSEARLRKVVESNVIGVFFAGLDGRILEANEAFLKLIGYSREDLGSGALRWDSITPPEFEELDQRAITELKTRGSCSPFEKEYLAKNGARVPVLLGGAMLPGSEEESVCIVVDLSARRRLENERRALHEELIQSQKMEAIGQLAGGIAHDFNNILNVIGGYGELIIDKLGQEDPLRRSAERVLIATKRAADLTAQLLAFSRKQILQKTVLDLNVVIGELLDMLRRLIREDVQLIFSPASDLHLVHADKVQVEQVLINLTVNARDALPQGGQIRIETRNVTVTPTTHIGSLASGEYACIAVADNGFGMDKETLERIFEPFFTTKEIGHGTGLGLSTVYGIIKQSGGDILAESQPGVGSLFHVYLPRAANALDAAQQPDISTPATWGGETLLLVEDEDPLRDAAQEYLESLGYTVLTAKDGMEALEISARYPGEVALLLTDIVLPRLGGRLVRERIQETRPGIKTIFISGYAEDIDPDLDGGPRVPFLQKPFLLRMLGRLVSDVLADNSSVRPKATV